MRKKYMIYHPQTNSSPSIDFYDKDHFNNLDDDKFSPVLYKNIGAAKSAISLALETSKFRSEQLEDLRNFLIGVQIVEIELTAKEVVYECIFDIKRISK